jgi:hypothetical protein
VASTGDAKHGIQTLMLTGRRAKGWLVVSTKLHGIFIHDPEDF